MSPTTRARSAARMLFGSTSAAVAELRGADASLRAGLPLSRRVGIVALAGGSGTTSTTASLASLLAQRRTGMVLAVDAAGGSVGLHRQLMGDADQRPAERDEAAAARRRTALTAADAGAGLASTASRLRVLDTTGTRRRAAAVAEWGAAVGPISRFFDLVVTDWGVRPAAADLEEVAGTCHLLWLVARSDRHSATAAAAALRALRETAGSARTGLVLVDVARSPDRVAAGLEQALGRPVRALPYEPERGRTPTPTSRRFTSRTRTAHIRLAVTVMNEAIASQTPAIVAASPAAATRSATAVPA